MPAFVHVRRKAKSMRPLVSQHLKTLVPYVPGKPIEETEREYGITDIAKLASNENCLGPSPKAVEAMKAVAGRAHLYPDAGAFYLKEKIAQRHAEHRVAAENIVLGNGTNEILTLAARAFLNEGEAVLFGWPTFVVYRLAARGLGRSEVAVPLRADYTLDVAAMIEAANDPSNAVKLVMVANPNNPTGRRVPKDDLLQLVDGLPDDVMLVLDEAYAEYVTAEDYPDHMAIAMKRPRTIATRTFSKAFGLAALRVGYAVGDPEAIDILNRLRDPFNVNDLGQRAALAALDDLAHVEASREHNDKERARLTAALEALDVNVTPSEANFVMATFGGSDAPAWKQSIESINEALLKQGVIIRPIAPYGLPHSARITVGTVAENDRLIAAIEGLREEQA